jgi:phenylacetate-coenzyme A ligase PaaK-like adenylate-forming protein
MFDLKTWLTIPPYSLDRRAKSAGLAAAFTELTRYHYANCPPYRNILNALEFDPTQTVVPVDLPFLPVRLFKELDLRSLPSEKIVKTMVSSGTTGQAVSKIYLDRETSANQMKVLTKLVAAFIGTQRLPMVILDTSAVIKDRTMFSARGAGVLGFSIFANDKIYALDEQMQLDIDGLKKFLEKHRGKPLLLFGFTFMIWQHFYKELVKLGVALDFSSAILIHGGGWKKLASEAVTSNAFRTQLREVCGINRIHDYYGMVEQTGSICLECEQGHLHTSIFSDVFVRRSHDFSPAAFGEAGIIEVLSVLPRSYPGHALLTEDEGVILGEDDCPCGRLGKYFKVLGRLKNAEIRGCSDTYAAKFPAA